ncbi:MAG: hypothetical protein ACM3SS_02015 [Rhodospirillaceae bacterium]
MNPSTFVNAAMHAVVALTAGNAVAATPQHTASPAVALPAIEVSALRDPVEKSYRKIVKGMELFEARHSLAPSASLRFKLLPRSRDTPMEGITLSVVGDTVNIPVPVSADNTVVFQRWQRALEENAVVVPNRRAGSMTWRTEIRTPGLPPDTRRLGDLRLECLVGMEAGLVSNDPPSILSDIAGLIADRAYCDQRVPHYLFFAERPLWSVTLVYGSRREILSVDDMYAGISRSPIARGDLRYCDCEVLLDRTYYAPLGDPSWPDDTLLEFEYMDDGVPASANAPPAIAPDGRSP